GPSPPYVSSRIVSVRPRERSFGRLSVPTSSHVVASSSGRSPSGVASTFVIFDQAMSGTMIRKASHRTRTSHSSRQRPFFFFGSSASRGPLPRRPGPGGGRFGGGTDEPGEAGRDTVRPDSSS